MTCHILSTSLKTQGILFDTLFHRSYCVSGSLSNLFLFFFFLHIYYNMNCFHITSFFKKIFNGGQASHLSSVSLWIAQPFLIYQLGPKGPVAGITTLTFHVPIPILSSVPLSLATPLKTFQVVIGNQLPLMKYSTGIRVLSRKVTDQLLPFINRHLDCWLYRLIYLYLIKRS